jgi:hypothetical protein
MRRSLIVAALFVAGCETTPALPPALPPEPCPPSAAAAVEDRVVSPLLTPAQRLALDVAGIGVVGDLYEAYALAEAQKEARAVRLENRIEQTRAWCLARNTDAD